MAGKGITKIGRVLGKLYSPGFGFLLLVVTYVPIILVIMFSLNESVIAAFPLAKFSLKWYQELFQNRSIMVAFRNTLIIGIVAVAGSLIIGVTAAFLLHRYKFRFSAFFNVVILLPFLLPGIFTGLALLLFFSWVGIPKSLFTVFIGQDNIGKYRPFMEVEGLIMLIKDRNTKDIRRQKIRCKLDALKLGINGEGQCLGQGGFAGSGIVFQKDMTSAYKTCQHFSNGRRLTSHDLFNIPGYFLIDLFWGQITLLSFQVYVGWDIP